MIGVDPKKVKIGLECCQYDSKSRCDGCPYDCGYDTSITQCTSDLAADVLALLDQLEKNQPEESEWVKMHGMMIPELCGYHECKLCGYHEHYNNRGTLYPFCPACGRKMKNGIQRKE